MDKILDMLDNMLTYWKTKLSRISMLREWPFQSFSSLIDDVDDDNDVPDDVRDCVEKFTEAQNAYIEEVDK